MNNINFPEANIKIAEHQEEYETVYAAHDSIEGSILLCFELSDEEITRMLLDKKLWLKMKTFNGPMQPVMLSVKKEDFI